MASRCWTQHWTTSSTRSRISSYLIPLSRSSQRVRNSVEHPQPSILHTRLSSYRTLGTLAPVSGITGIRWGKRKNAIPFFTDNQTLSLGDLEVNAGSLRLQQKRRLQDDANALSITEENARKPTVSSMHSDANVPVNYKPVQPLTLSRTLKIYSQLSKARLSSLVVLTAMSGVALSPFPASITVLLSTAVGTALCSASANAFNQISEVPFDAQMPRTRQRPLVRKAISPLHAASFALCTGIAGPVILAVYTNPITAALGAFNIGLYAGVYTMLKRKSILNTWVGSVVGAIPPLMGWTACGGSLLPSASSPLSLYLPSFLSSSTLASFLTNDLPNLTNNLITTIPHLDNPLAPLALFLYHFSWQFPHFNSISYMVRSSYAQAGYSMLSVLSPRKNALVALRHSIACTLLCSFLIPLSGLTTWAFALTSLVPNAILIQRSWAFWKVGGEVEKVARRLWGYSLLYLPIILGLMMYHKRGMDWLNWMGLGSTEESATIETQHNIQE